MKKVSGLVIIVLVVQFVVLSSCKEKENEVPNIEITAPEEGDVYMQGDQVTIKANADDPDGSIEMVKFYLQNQDVSDVSEAPYEYQLTLADSLLGDVNIRAVAVDNEGGAKSASITIVVDTPGGFNPDLNYGTIQDVDGNSYKTIEIGEQNWMAENLKVTHYADGTPVPLVAEDALWSSLGNSDRAYCWYDNKSEYADTTGVLYSWGGAMNGSASVNDTTARVQGVCPSGWHLPSDEEWKELEMELGMSQAVADKYEWRGTYQGGDLKEKGFSHWDNPNLGSTNSSGFTALSGGFRSNTGTYYGIGEYATFWSATEETGSSTIWYRALNFDKTQVYRYFVQGNRGVSVRCVEDR
jgi:uncharacterized protein (TIGR02145 family)